MSSHAELVDTPIYFNPKDLITFYKEAKQIPNIEVIRQDCIRYGYGIEEIKAICSAYQINDHDYQSIRNSVYDAINPIARVINSTNKLQDQRRINAAWEHIQDLHFRNNCYGNIIFGCPRTTPCGHKSMWQYAIQKSKITKTVVARILTLSNVYIAVNTSRTYQRRSDQIISINALYLDIDNVSNVDGFINACQSEGRFDKIMPSKIISSGGGIHMYFYLRNAYAKGKLIPYVSHIQGALQDLYPEADRLGDLARFLRLDGGTYDKPNKISKTVQTVYKSDRVYKIDEIGPQLVPPYRSKKISKPKNKKNGTFNVKDKRNGIGVVPHGNWHQVELCRVRDIEYLFNIGHFDSDRRKRGIYFYALFVLRASGNISKAAEMAWQMNLELKSPLSRAEFENQLYSVRKYGFDYNYSSHKLVNQLDIKQLSNDKISGLRSIAPTDCKNRRKNTKKRKARRNREGLTSREASATENYKKVKALRDQGYNQVNIAKKIGLTKSYVSKIVKKIRMA